MKKSFIFAFLLLMVSCSASSSQKKPDPTISFKVGMLTYETRSSTEVVITLADTSITSVNLCTPVTHDGKNYSVTSIGDSAFCNCTNLTSIIIPNGISDIGEYAFYNCTNLTPINIPNSVESIGYEAFVNTKFYNNKSNWKDGSLYIDNCLLQVQNNEIGDYTVSVTGCGKNMNRGLGSPKT